VPFSLGHDRPRSTAKLRNCMRHSGPRPPSRQTWPDPQQPSPQEEDSRNGVHLRAQPGRKHGL